MLCMPLQVGIIERLCLGTLAKWTAALLTSHKRPLVSQVCMRLLTKRIVAADNNTLLQLQPITQRQSLAKTRAVIDAVVAKQLRVRERAVERAIRNQLKILWQLPFPGCLSFHSLVNDINFSWLAALCPGGLPGSFVSDALNAAMRDLAHTFLESPFAESLDSFLKHLLFVFRHSRSTVSLDFFAEAWMDRCDPNRQRKHTVHLAVHHGKQTAVFHGHSVCNWCGCVQRWPLTQPRPLHIFASHGLVELDS